MQRITPARIALAVLTLLYVVVGAIYILKEGNTEFLAYVVLFIFLFAAAWYAMMRFDLPPWMLWLISILGALHLVGGGLQVRGDVLYNLVLIPIPNWTGLTIWKFDQLVHPYGAAAIAVIAYALLLRYTRGNRVILIVAAFLIANGAGALNEVVEFITKITIPHTDVGGYYNTALDLFFNMLGAFIGSILAFIRIRTTDA